MQQLGILLPTTYQVVFNRHLQTDWDGKNKKAPAKRGIRIQQGGLFDILHLNIDH